MIQQMERSPRQRLTGRLLQRRSATPSRALLKMAAPAAVNDPNFFPIESAAPAVPLTTPLASLLTRHLIRDGELILLVVKPSLWFILLSSLRFIATTLILAIAAKLWMQFHTHVYVEAMVFCLSGRLMFATVSWIGRLYLLTDQRVLRVSGVLNVEIFDCPLRKVARTRQISTFREKITGLGSIEIVPQDESRACGVWQMVAHPAEVNERINSALRRAKAG